jgi:hypothetical protein
MVGSLGLTFSVRIEKAVASAVTRRRLAIAALVLLVLGA